MQVPESLDPVLVADAVIVRAHFHDLERLGLVGGDDTTMDESPTAAVRRSTRRGHHARSRAALLRL
jgi:hypothetical protein